MLTIAKKVDPPVSYTESDHTCTIVRGSQRVCFLGNVFSRGLLAFEYLHARCHFKKRSARIREL